MPMASLNEYSLTLSHPEFKIEVCAMLWILQFNCHYGRIENYFSLINIILTGIAALKSENAMTSYLIRQMDRIDKDDLLDK